MKNSQMIKTCFQNKRKNSNRLCHGKQALKIVLGAKAESDQCSQDNALHSSEPSVRTSTGILVLTVYKVTFCVIVWLKLKPHQVPVIPMRHASSVHLHWAAILPLTLPPLHCLPDLRSWGSWNKDLRCSNCIACCSRQDQCHTVPKMPTSSTVGLMTLFITLHSKEKLQFEYITKAISYFILQ